MIQVPWTRANPVYWQPGGFAGFGAARIVNLGGSSATLTWNSTAGFLTTGQNLILGSTLTDGVLDFRNPIDFNSDTRTIFVANGADSVDARLSNVPVMAG